jgi:hypothetical protein
MLRLELPVKERDRDVAVVVVVNDVPSDDRGPLAALDDAWSDCRQKLEAAGLRVPAPGLTNPGPVNPIDLPGPPASELLIRDRR